MINWGYPVITQYAYDAWGRVIYSNGTMCDVNPIRYRGYYYDSETGLYYLQSRYYDPLVKRFINPDSFASTGQGFAGYNMFVYCNNNPVMMSDETGNRAIEHADICVGYSSSTAPPRKSIIGYSYTAVVNSKQENPVDAILYPVLIKQGIKHTTTIDKEETQNAYLTLYHTYDMKNPYNASNSGISVSLGNALFKLSSGWDNLGVSMSITRDNITKSFSLIGSISEFNIYIQEATTEKTTPITSVTSYTNYSVDAQGLVYLIVAFSLAPSIGPGTTFVPAYGY